MNELSILQLFYDEMKAQGTNRENVFISFDEATAAVLAQKSKKSVELSEVHKLVDTCIANEWLERTTIDPGYNFLSLTEAGLQVILLKKYS